MGDVADQLLTKNLIRNMTPIEVLKMLKSKIDEAKFYKSNYVLQTNDVESISQALRIHVVSDRSEQLVDFLLHLNSKELINNHDFDYEKEAKKYLKKLNNCH